jgi:hypothetical protein
MIRHFRRDEFTIPIPLLLFRRRAFLKNRVVITHVATLRRYDLYVHDSRAEKNNSNNCTSARMPESRDLDLSISAIRNLESEKRKKDALDNEGRLPSIQQTMQAVKSSSDPSSGSCFNRRHDQANNECQRCVRL